MAKDPYQKPNTVFIMIGIVMVIAIIAIVVIITGVIK